MKNKIINYLISQLETEPKVIKTKPRQPRKSGQHAIYLMGELTGYIA